ncbi:MAG: prolipoprotein diacylglyceryl transferase [Sedimentisphaerales bacterium]|nr:prolipoprotein diacylglyceryl transferase [Sedimentisphaerales bacterium]
MFPELFELPIVHVTIKSYGTMIVIGFLLAVLLMRRLLKGFGENPDHITNVALYALIAGVIGARIFYVVHFWEKFRGEPLSVFAVWQGGLEYLGGVLLAIVVVLIYLFWNRLPMRTYMDVLSIGLMLGLGFGRIGCFWNGCCFGKVTDFPLGIRFPYASPPYVSQVYPDPKRDRNKPLLELPAEYYGYLNTDGKWIPSSEANRYNEFLKPKSMLTPEQKEQVKGPFRALPVHPTQLYASANAFLLSLITLLVWRKIKERKPGCTFGLMFILYGTTRFLLEMVRNDNPFERSWWTIYRGGTMSQNLGIYMVILGIIMLLIFGTQKSPKRPMRRKRSK